MIKQTLDQVDSHLPSSEEIINWIQLSRSENVGPATFFRLLEIFGSVENVLKNFNEFLPRNITNRQIRLFDRNSAIQEFEKVKKFGAEIILFCDSRFPKLLHEIHDYPPFITVKGDCELLAKDKISIVGPRNPSHNAILSARKVAIEVGQNSFVTVSGMARGVDSAVHESSILSGTIAVLAGGINHIYPAENSKLYDQIAKCGLIISEMPFDYVPKNSNFVQRNRIVSGLSKALVIVEASLRSGSLTTARFAIDQGREVFAIPGSPFDPRCLGANLLIKEGAGIIAQLEDIKTEVLNLKSNYSVNNSKQKKDSDSLFFNQEQNNQKDFSSHEVNKIQSEILKILNTSPTEIDQIICQLDFPTNLLNIALIQLELLGKIEINRGKISKIIEFN